jgi:hypothetical protein
MLFPIIVTIGPISQYQHHPFGLQSLSYPINNHLFDLDTMELPWKVHGTSVCNDYLKFEC